MKKLLIICLFTLTNLFSHTLIMNIIDNKDDTITVIGSLSTGQEAAGAMLRLEAIADGKVIFKKRLPDEGELTIPIPKEEYQVVLDGGPEHQIVKEGIAPIAGYSQTLSEQKTKDRALSQSKSSENDWSLSYIILISIILLLICLTIYFSKKNTDKIIKLIKEQS